MKTLELKHLAPYLPYELKMITNTSGRGAYDRHEHRRLNKIEVLKLTNFEFLIFLKRKPLLIPLSDLTKEMLSKYYTQLMDSDLERIIKETKASPLNQSYTFTNEFLLKKHFDIYDLIPKGLAIDINTI